MNAVNLSAIPGYVAVVPKRPTRRDRTRSPVLQAELERIAIERLEASREVERAYKWELARVCGECFASCMLGLMSIGFAFHTTDFAIGQIAFWGGMLIGTVGVFVSVITAYHRGEERGDW